MLGLRLRIAARSNPTASAALDGTRTCHPIACAHVTSLLRECHGSPTSLPNPPGIRTTIGAANRLFVRHRIVPQLLSCSVAGSAYLRNWISATGIRPDTAMPTARPMIPSSDRLVSNTRAVPEALAEPLGHEMHAAFDAHVLAEHEHFRIGLEFRCQCPPDGLREPDHGPFIGRGAGAAEGRQFLRRQARPPCPRRPPVPAQRT